jgi:photosystem II stability/assembly factor-like uncharacterized protein
MKMNIQIKGGKMKQSIAVLSLFVIWFSLCGVAHAIWISNPLGDPYLYARDVFFLDANTGWVSGAVQDQPNDNHAYPRTLRTDDGGETWSYQLQEDSVGTLLGVYFNDYNSGWVVGGGGSGQQVYRTTDGGMNWSMTNVGGTNYLLNVVATDSSNVWAVGDAIRYSGSVVYSSDGFQTFDFQEIVDTPTLLYDIAMFNSGIGYTLDGGRVYKTDDSGNAWDLIHNNVGFPGAFGIYTMSFINETTGWIAGQYGNMLYTSDGGLNWITLEIGNESRIMDISFVNELEGWVLAGNYMEEIWSTKNGGLTWTLEHTSTEEPLPIVKTEKRLV